MIGIFLFLNQVAHAIPVLGLSGNSIVSEDLKSVTLYPDSQNPKLFYYFPNTGKVLKDEKGIPDFTMVKLNQPVDGVGGYISGVLGLENTKAQADALKLKRDAGFQLAPLPVRSSYFTLTSQKAGEREFLSGIFKEVALPDLAGRPEDPFGFSATLTPVGAAILKAALVTNQSNGTTFQYCYTVSGTTPKFHGEVTLNYHKVYEHFMARASGRKWFQRFEVRAELEKLKESGSIGIKMEGGTETERAYLESLTEKMMARFFEPELPNRRSEVSANWGLSYTRIEEDRDRHIILDSSEPMELNYCTTMSLGTILKDYPELYSEIDA
jgi:hypothetical protein